MTTAVTLKLTQGTRTLDLNAGRYYPGLDFAPPSATFAPLLASGTSANRYGGSNKISERAADREWSFTIYLTGASDAEIGQAARDLASMLSLAGDASNPLYLEYKANSDTPEPLWGQYGANFRYEITHADPPTPDPSWYPVSDLRARRIPYRVSLLIKPFALGKRQRLASVVGGVLENTIGTVDGLSRGLQVPEATTNKMTNPVFGNGSLFNWTASASLTLTRNVNPKYILFGMSSFIQGIWAGSAHLIARSTSQTFTQSINVGNTNNHILSCYAKRADGGAITTSDLDLYYGSAKTTTYTSVGDGWYRLTASFAGVASATATGVTVKNGRAVYVDGFQLEEKSYVTPLCYGDLLGCAWTGTAHDSTSTRTAARAKVTVTAGIASTFNIGRGTIRLVWRAPYAHTAFSASIKPFAGSGGNIRMIFNKPSNTWSFGDGTNLVTSSADTFNQGDIIVFHCVYQPGELRLYKNGASIASGSTYTPPTLPADIFIGTNQSSGEHTNGTFLDFSIFDVPFTAAQASNDYTNILQAVTDHGRLMPVPWLWTKDGDNQVDNANESTTDNFAVMGGVPGTAHADTEFSVLLDRVFGQLNNTRSLWLGKFAIPNTVVPILYNAGSTVSVSTAENSSGSLGLNDWVNQEYLAGKEFYCFAVFTDAGTNLTWATRTSYGIGTLVRTDYVTPASDATARLFVTGPTPIRPIPNTSLENFINITSLTPVFKRTSGTANITTSFIQWLPRPIIRVQQTGSVGASTFSRIVIRGNAVLQVADDASTLGQENTPNVTGDRVELEPDKINYIYSIMGDPVGTFNKADTMTYTVHIVPRWSIQ